MKQVLRILALVGAFQAVLCLLFLVWKGPGPGFESYIFGNLLGWVNFAGLSILWRIVFNFDQPNRKKRVALATVGIVFKYAILIGVFVQVQKFPKADIDLIILGFFSNTFALFIFGFGHKLWLKG